MSTDAGRGRPPGRTGEDLLALARQVFLEHGYAGATMDEVARRARISKSSLYREHRSKPALYEAVVRQWAALGRDSMRPALERLVGCDDVRAGLVELADTMRAGILSTPVLQMRRLVISEALTQPDAAAGYLRDSWDANIQHLADALRELSGQGRLRVDDPSSAAEQLTWLVVGAPLNAQLLTGTDDHHAAPVGEAVELFLARYPTR